MRFAAFSLLLALGCASPRETVTYFPTPGPLYGSRAAGLLASTHQSSLLEGPDRMRLLGSDAWFQNAVIYTLAPMADSAVLTLVEAPKGRPRLTRTIAIGRERWLATEQYFHELGLLSGAPPSGQPPALDGYYLLWEARRAGRYASATYGYGTDPLARAETWFEYLVEHPN